MAGASCCPSHCRTRRCGSLAPRSTCPCPPVYLPASLPACLSSICFSDLTFPPCICTKGGRQECSGRHASMHACRHRTRTPPHKRVSEHDSERGRERLGDSETRRERDERGARGERERREREERERERERDAERELHFVRVTVCIECFPVRMCTTPHPLVWLASAAPGPGHVVPYRVGRAAEF